MSKGKKRCYFCGCAINNQNRTSIKLVKLDRFANIMWTHCCHKCRAKEEKKP
jgi:hypothetical protein